MNGNQILSLGLCLIGIFIMFLFLPFPIALVIFIFSGILGYMWQANRERSYENGNGNGSANMNGIQRDLIEALRNPENGEFISFVQGEDQNGIFYEVILNEVYIYTGDDRYTAQEIYNKNKQKISSQLGL